MHSSHRAADSYLRNTNQANAVLKISQMICSAIPPEGITPNELVSSLANEPFNLALTNENLKIIIHLLNNPGSLVDKSFRIRRDPCDLSIETVLNL